MGANELPWPRGLQITATFDALQTCLNSVYLKGYLKEILGGQGDHHVTKLVLGGANKFFGFSKIGPTLDALLTRWFKGVLYRGLGVPRGQHVINVALSSPNQFPLLRCFTIGSKINYEIILMIFFQQKQEI